MKIIKDNVIYIQNNDIIQLNHSDMDIPASIFMKIFGNGIVIIDDSNRYEFVSFTEPEEIEFLRNIDWILDYDEVKDLSEEEIITLAEKIMSERNELANKFLSMTESEKEKNIAMVDQCELINHKMFSLRDFLWFKQGHIQMELPEEVSQKSKLEGRFRRLIKRNKPQK